MTEAEKERAAIVRFLEAIAERANDGKLIDKMVRVVVPVLVKHIQRGEHLKGKK